MSAIILPATPEAAPAVAEAAKEVVTEKAEVETKSEIALKDLSEKMDKMVEENKTLKSDLKTLKESPVFKSIVSDQNVPELKAEVQKVQMLDLIG